MAQDQDNNPNPNQRQQGEAGGTNRKPQLGAAQPHSKEGGGNNTAAPPQGGNVIIFPGYANSISSADQSQSELRLPSEPQSSQPQQAATASSTADPSQYDFEELLRQVQGKRSRIGKPPREAT